MSLTVLIIDDSEDDQLSYRRALRETGWHLTMSPTLVAGQAAKCENKPDVILLDYQLPDGDGLTFLRQMAGANAATEPPVIMLTGEGDEHVAVEAIKAGATDYLVKDVAGNHLSQLPWAIQRALREHALRLEKLNSEQQLRLAANVYHTISEGVLVTEPDGSIVSANPAFCCMTGYPSEELIGHHTELFQSDRHDSEFYRTKWTHVREQGYWQGEIWIRRKNGDLFLARETITAIRDTQGRMQNLVSVLTDITEAKRTEELIRHQAYYDTLTNLPNRLLFMDRLQNRLAYSRRHQTSIAVLFIDLDGFKTINDELGHEIGDDLLKEMAVRLKDCVRASDTVARLGGDEFTAILNDDDCRQSAARVARKILDRFSEPFLLGSHQRRISASIGISLYPADSDDAVELLNMADSAMYQAKRAGKARFAFASRTDSAAEALGKLPLTRPSF